MTPAFVIDRLLDHPINPMTTKIQKKQHQKKEASVTNSQRLSNRNARKIYAINRDEEHLSDRFVRQMGLSCACGQKLDVNEHNNMSRKISCKKRFCKRCVRLIAWKRDMALFPSIHEICEANRRDPKTNPRLWFVTLTLPTCEASELLDRIDHLQKEWRISYNSLKKDTCKGYVNGLRKLEINPRPKIKRPKTHTDFKYHAHLHVLIQGRNNALYLRRKWLGRHPEAAKWAQDIRPFDQEKGSLVELLKYLAKPVTTNDPSDSKAYYKAVGHIYDKLMGRRTIFSYGSVKAADKDEFYGMIDERGQVVFKKGGKFLEALKTATEGQQERIKAFLGEEKAEASRPIAESVWNFVNGHYVNALTQEQLCSEADVKAAAAAGGEKSLRSYYQEKAWREGNDQAATDQALAKDERGHEAARMVRKVAERKWQRCDNVVSDIRNE